MRWSIFSLYLFYLVGCGSTIDPIMGGSGPFPVTSSGAGQTVIYGAEGSNTYLRFNSGFLIGGHVSISKEGNLNNKYWYIGVLGQSRGGEYRITTPSTRAYLDPHIEFSSDMHEVVFEWSESYDGPRKKITLYRL